jgi:hypothetical protein
MPVALFIGFVLADRRVHRRLHGSREHACSYDRVHVVVEPCCCLRFHQFVHLPLPRATDRLRAHPCVYRALYLF